MFIRLLSDLHTEFAPHTIQRLPEDFGSILILAGDIGLYKQKSLLTFIQETAAQFYKVIMIPGNHEYYGSTIRDGDNSFRKEITASCNNVTLLNGEAVVIDDVVFIGATLWTNFRNGNPLSMMNARDCMNDYQKIRYGNGSYRKIRPEDIVPLHNRSADFIFSFLRENKGKFQKSVVITHHSPSHESIHPRFQEEEYNDWYTNSLDYEILDAQPDFWFHGHMHNSADYMIENTRVVCNPRGYPKGYDSGGGTFQNHEFNPTLRFEI